MEQIEFAEGPELEENEDEKYIEFEYSKRDLEHLKDLKKC